MSLKNISFTQVPQGEIVVVMIGKEVYRFLGNIKDHWVDQKTGEIWRTKEFNDGFDNIGPNGEKNMSRKKDVPSNQPIGFKGIYWMGLWPFTQVHVYPFKWNKWDKPEKTKEGKAIEFDIQPRNEKVDSLYFMSGYAFKVHGAETKEKIPVDVILVLVVRVTNAMTALFGVKNGWYATLDGKVLGSGRDFIGITKIDELTKLQHEEGDIPSGDDTTEAHITRKSFLRKMMYINDDPNTPEDPEHPRGNEGIRRTLGVEIVSASFMRYDITDPAVAQGIKDKMLLAFNAAETARAQNIETGWRVKRITDEGAARAGAIQAAAEAVRDNPLAARIAVAEKQTEGVLAVAKAIGEQTGLKTLILGKGAMPTINVDDDGK